MPRSMRIAAESSWIAFEDLLKPALSFRRHPDAVPYGQVGEDPSAIGTVDDGRRAVGGVYQEAWRLSMRSRDKADACHTLAHSVRTGQMKYKWNIDNKKIVQSHNIFICALESIIE